MIRAFQKEDLSAVMQIWLDVNVKAHSFISEAYWRDHYEMVKEMLPQAKVYVMEAEHGGQIEGFIGLTDDYVAGLFVREESQSKGIGKQLLDHVKGIKASMTLSVYQKNTRALSFYRREHFTVRSENTDDGTGEKEFVMVWRRPQEHSEQEEKHNGRYI